ncbi:hypothetical protein HZA57_08300, partial [Candidatus Poribacteria bacterium]|nr:hypothetical protein [Candidatus Poribacteria bacterium]
MIAHSGIGTAIRGLLHAWTKSPPPFRLTLLGPEKLIEGAVPTGLSAIVSNFEAPLYSPGGMLASAPAGDAQVMLGMHYVVPLHPRLPLVTFVHDLIHMTHPPRRGTA